MPNAPDSTKDIIAAIDALQLGVVNAIGSINLAENVDRTIYITAAGNDTTNDGTIGLPFLTITKALSTIKRVISSGVTITINIGIGTFDLSIADFNTISYFTGSGILHIEGALTLVDSGFAMGAALALDPMTYNVSGGNTATWTLNQWKHRFLKSGTNYYPITHNALTPTLSIAAPNGTTGTEIYEAQTIINMNYVTGIIYTFQIKLELFQLQLIQLVSSLNLASYLGILLQIIWINNSAARSIFFSNSGNAIQSPVTIRQTTINYSNLTFYTQSIGISSNIYIYFPTGLNGGTMSVYGRGTFFIANIVLENASASANTCGIFCGANQNQRFQQNIKFVNMPAKPGFLFQETTEEINLWTLTNLILVNTGYLFMKQNAFSDYKKMVINLDFSKILGVPVVRYFLDNMYEFVNLSNGRSIQLKGLIYPENEQNLTGALTNNATTQIIVGNKLQNETISIDYEVKRAGYRKGSFDIINNGAALTMSTDTFITDGTADVSGANVIFTVNYNANEIRIAVQLSNAVAGTLKYNVRRTMITPLTI
jgi:hypothetical protein